MDEEKNVILEEESSLFDREIEVSMLKTILNYN